MIVVAKWYDKWVRVSIEEPHTEPDRHIVRLVDHGGFYTFSSGEMRKIRTDYLALPFQAIEIFIANIKPANGSEWSEDAYAIVAQICTGNLGQAQIEGYINNNVYCSLFFNIQKHGVSLSFIKMKNNLTII